MRAAHLVLFGLVGCGGAAASAPPATPAPAHDTASVAAPHLTDRPPSRGADCPACFEVTNLPALSDDGRTIAAFVPLPIYFEEHGGAVDVDGYALVVLDATSGVERARVVLLDRADLEMDRSTLTDCCRASPDDCDPDLCVPEPDAYAASEAERSERLAGRLVAAHALLAATSWHPLTLVPTEHEEGDDDSSTIALAVYATDAAENEAPFLEATITPDASCSDCEVRDVTAHRDAATGLRFVVVVTVDPSGGPGHARCFVQQAAPTSR